jgi:hypothetical protein
MLCRGVTCGIIRLGRRYRKARQLTFDRDLWLGLAVQRGRIRRLVFVFFGLLNRLVGWNDPIKAALGYSTEDETSFLGNERQHGTEKIRGGLWSRFVGLAAVDALPNL